VPGRSGRGPQQTVVIRIAIVAGSFEAIARMLPLGGVG
jgi:hypothetical protein